MVTMPGAGMAGMFGMGGGMNPYQGMGAGGQVPPPWASMLGGAANAMGAPPQGSSPWAGLQQMPPGATGQPAGPNPNMLAMLQAISAQQGQGAPAMPPWAMAQPQRAAAMQAAMMGMPPGAQGAGMGGFGLAGMLGNPLAGSMPRGRGPAPQARQPVRSPAAPRRGFTYAGANYSPGTISLSGY